MTATVLTRPSRQPAVLVAVAGLHVVAFVFIANGMVPRLVDALPAPRELVVVQRIPAPVVRLQPGLPVPEDYMPLPAPLPDMDIPRVTEEAPPADSTPVAVASAAGSGTPGRGPDFQPPALQMRDSRLAALVDACYPSAARRMGEEGRAVALVVVDADGRAASWTQMQGSGFPRLDAALGCVIRRLQFLPARRDGRAVVAEVRLPIAFQLR